MTYATKSLATALCILASLAAPAMAQSDDTTAPSYDQTRPGLEAVPQDPRISDAFNTETAIFTPTVAEDRVAAVTYMDDALSLIAMARAHLNAGQGVLAVPELMGASGKVTNAQLLLFKDKRFGRDVAPIALQLEQALMAARETPTQASAIVNDLQPQVASLYRTQLAAMGGGAGMGGTLEDLNNTQQ